MRKHEYYYDTWLKKVKARNRTFNFILGGRGTGKTVGHILYELEEKRKFIYLRRTQDEIDLQIDNQVSEGMDLFKKVNKVRTKYYDENALPIYPERFNKHTGLITDEEEKVYGSLAAISTIAKARGLDGDDLDDLIYDEFIPENHVRKMKAEGEAFLNAYETLNRNREFEGRPPLKAYILSNAFNMKHDLFREMGLIHILQKMTQNNIMLMDLPERDILILKFYDEEFIEKKKNTALYKATKGTKFYQMSLYNEFAYDDLTGVESKDLRNYFPVFAYGPYGFFKHRGGNKYYCTKTKMRFKDHYEQTDKDLIAFKAIYARQIYVLYMQGLLDFENYEIKDFVLNFICK